jgi:CheY-like chemotaxis protein
MKVLVADDDRVHVRLVSERLKRMGHDVVVAFDGMQTWMAAIRSAPDLVLLDINMPAGTGLEVLRKLKTNTRTSLIPVIVVSASHDPQTALAIQNLGADEFFLKPVDFDRLDQISRQLLPARSQLRYSRCS